MLILLLRRQVSVIIVSALAIMQPTMSDGIEMSRVRACPPLVAAALFVGGATVYGSQRQEGREGGWHEGTRSDRTETVDGFVGRP